MFVFLNATEKKLLPWTNEALRSTVHALNISFFFIVITSLFLYLYFFVLKRNLMFTHSVSVSDFVQVTELTQFLIENSEILGENIPNLLDTDEGILITHFRVLIISL